jgi:hypothetical protein
MDGEKCFYQKEIGKQREALPAGGGGGGKKTKKILKIFSAVDLF